jgi:hypothetical protein
MVRICIGIAQNIYVNIHYIVINHYLTCTRFASSVPKNYSYHLFVTIFSSIHQELEEKLARREEAAEVAMTMQSQISKFYEVECENSKLKEENSYLRYVAFHIFIHI